METKDLDSWQDLVTELDRLRALSGSRQSDVLFRGQSDANWKLETTLERAVKTEWSLPRYFRAMKRVDPAIVAHTGHNWSLPETREYDLWATEFDNVASRRWKAYEFMAYLRHHGFPSPLLDWSRSPYVAAFFAFRAETGSSDRVALYAYREHAGHGKLTGSNRAFIVQLPRHVSTHARHFRQQGSYTACIHLVDSCGDYFGVAPQGSGFVYANHEEVFGNQLGDLLGQDELWKFTLPRALRPSVLSILNDFNLNAYSLFGTEDALVETLANAELT